MLLGLRCDISSDRSTVFRYCFASCRLPEIRAPQTELPARNRSPSKLAAALSGLWMGTHVHFDPRVGMKLVFVSWLDIIFLDYAFASKKNITSDVMQTRKHGCIRHRASQPC